VLGIQTLSRVDFHEERNVILVAVSLGLAMSPVAFPNFYKNLPPEWQIIVGQQHHDGQPDRHLAEYLLQRPDREGRAGRGGHSCSSSDIAAIEVNGLLPAVVPSLAPLAPELLAILAGNLPSEGDEGVSDTIQRLLDDYPEFQVDRTLRDFSFQFERYSRALDSDPDKRFALSRLRRQPKRENCYYKERSYRTVEIRFLSQVARANQSSALGSTY